jgi:hypothetical protein
MSHEPVAYINVEERKLEWAGPVEWNTPIITRMDKVPLYTHQYSDLTDEEIEELREYHGINDWLYETSITDFAKAILRKAQEK